MKTHEISTKDIAASNMPYDEYIRERLKQVGAPGMDKVFVTCSPSAKMLVFTWEEK